MFKHLQLKIKFLKNKKRYCDVGPRAGEALFAALDANPILTSEGTVNSKIFLLKFFIFLLLFINQQFYLHLGYNRNLPELTRAKLMERTSNLMI